MAEQAAEYGLNADDVKWLKWVVQRVRGGELGVSGGGNGFATFGMLLVKRGSDVSMGAAATFTVYSGAAKGSETDSGWTIEGYCRFASYSADSWALAVPVDGGWEVFQPGGNLCSQIAGLAGYDDTKTQFVGHASGVCQVFDGSECEP